jgi:type III secretory pathway component EscV
VSADQPVIDAEVTLGGPLVGLACEDVAAAAATQLSALSGELSVPGRAEVTVHPDDDPAAPPVAFSMHGAPLSYPRWMEAQLLAWYRHRREADGPGSTQVWSWADQLAADETGTVAAVADLARHAVAADAGSLLGPRQISAWLERAVPQAADGVGEFLAGMLDLRLRIDEQAGNIRAAMLNEPGEEQPADTAEVFERVVQAIRPAEIEVRVEPEYLEEITSTWSDTATEAFPELRDTLYIERGLRLPGLRLVPAPEQAPRCFAIRVNHITDLPFTGVPAQMRLVNVAAGPLASLAPDARPAISPGQDQTWAYVPTSWAEELGERGYTVRDALGHLILALSQTVRRLARALIDVGVVMAEFERFSRIQPELARFAGDAVSPVRLTRLVRCLVDEGVPVRDLRGLLQPLVDRQVTAGLPDSDDALLAFARQAIGPLLSGRAKHGGTILAYLMDPEFAVGLLTADDTGRDNARAARRTLATALDTQLARLSATADPKAGTLTPALLTTARTRPAVRRAIRAGWPQLPVLAFEELDPTANLLPIRRLPGTD